MQNELSFGAAYAAADRVHAVISAAFRSNSPVCPDSLADTILFRYPDCSMSRDEIQRFIRESAFMAGVAIASDQGADGVDRPSLG